MDDIDKNAKIIWDYMLMHAPLEKADAIFVLRSHDTRVAERAAELFTDGYAPLVIVSGGVGRLTQDMFDKPEADVFRDILVAGGVAEDKIIVEPNATNTSENVRFTYALLRELGKTLRSFILVQKPYMERRTYATFKKQWPDAASTITVTSPVMSYEEYMNGSSLDKELVISVMVGDLQRIRDYSKLGFQIEQNIPEEVWQAYQALIGAGYDEHLMR